MGLDEFQKGEFDQAITDLTKAIELDSKNAEAYNSRGFPYAAKGKYDQAITDYNLSSG
jgi:Flp pilus assembly protein TadD